MVRDYLRPRRLVGRGSDDEPALSEPELDLDPFLASVALLLAVSWFGHGD